MAISGIPPFPRLDSRGDRVDAPAVGAVSIPARLPFGPLSSKRLLALASDGALVEQIWRGNYAAFSVAFERHAVGLLGFRQRWLPQPPTRAGVAAAAGRTAPCRPTRAPRCDARNRSVSPRSRSAGGCWAAPHGAQDSEEAHVRRRENADSRRLSAVSRRGARRAVVTISRSPNRGSGGCASTVGVVALPLAASSSQSPGTPFSWWIPRGAKPRPEPATRPLTVRETSVSPGAAAAPIRAPATSPTSAARLLQGPLYGRGSCDDE
jgi:hypothetical protein